MTNHCLDDNDDGCGDFYSLSVQVIRAVDPDLAKKKRVAVRNMELVRMMIIMMIVMMMMMIVMIR